MKRRFHSKLGFIIPALILLGAGAEVYMVLELNWVAAAIIAVPTLFVIYLYFSTSYIVTKDEKLKVRSGFLFKRELYIKSIKKIRPTRDHRASPALSFDRLEISYNRYGRIVVSPDKKTEFIKELKDVNPRITVE